MILYHASSYDADVLMPGIYLAGELIKWDETESNEYLYACLDQQEAIAQGFFSGFSKVTYVKEIHSHDNTVTVVCQDPRKLMRYAGQLIVYLYAISGNHEWIAVDNKHNGMKGEYKTKSKVSTFLYKQSISYAEWSRNKKIKFLGLKPDYLSWK